MPESTREALEKALKPCPFCGGEAIARTRLGGISGAVEIVGCTKCGADTDAFKTEVEAIAAWNRRASLPTQEEAGGGEGGQDRKFKFENGRFVNRVSGEAIPDDEPVILFRARDRHALSVLDHYLGLAADPRHRQAIGDRIAEFSAFREAHPERLKEPGITGHIRLNSELPSQDVAGLKANLRHKLSAGEGSWFGGQLDDAVDFTLAALSSSKEPG